MYGESILAIDFLMDYDFKDNKDITSGKIFRSIGNSSAKFVSISFTDADDAVKHINSLVACELITSITGNFNVLDNLSSQFGNLSDASVNEVQSLLYNKQEKYTDKVIPILENLLKSLKGETN